MNRNGDIRPVRTLAGEERSGKRVAKAAVPSPAYRRRRLTSFFHRNRLKTTNERTKEAA